MARSLSFGLREHVVARGMARGKVAELDEYRLLDGDEVVEPGFADWQPGAQAMGGRRA